MNVKYWGLAFGAAAAGVFAASSAAAQVTADAMLQGRPTEQIKAAASVQVEHDSNVARASDAQAAALGVTPEDTTYAPVVSVDIIKPIGRQAVFLQGSASYLFHQNNKQLNSAQINLAGGGAGHVAHCGISLDGGYFQGRSQLEQVQAATTNVNNVLEVKRADFSLTCEVSGALGFVVNAGYTQGDNSLPQVAVSDYRSTTVSGGIVYGRPSVNSIELLAGYTHTDTPNTIAKTIGSDGYEQQNIGIQLSRHVGARIEATATVNYSRVNLLTPENPILPPGPTGGDNKGFTYSANVDYRVTSRLDLHATAARQFHPTQLIGSTYELSTNYLVRADYKLGARLNVEVGADQLENSGQASAQAELISAVPTLTDSTVKGIFASVRYQQSSRISLVLDARHEHRTANLSQFEYTSNRVGLSLAVAY